MRLPANFSSIGRSKFRRALLVAHPSEPIRKATRARSVRNEILTVVPEEQFLPVMTVNVSDATKPSDVTTVAHAHPSICGVKIFWAGLNGVHSESSVNDLKSLQVTLERLQDERAPVSISAVDKSLDAERRLVDAVAGIAVYIPMLRIVFNRIRTVEAVQYVIGNVNAAATIAPADLLSEQETPCHGAMRHFMESKDRRSALINAATDGCPRFFAGTHTTTICAIEAYATAFDEAGALTGGELERFLCRNGASFFGFKPTEETITLERVTWRVSDPNPALTGRELSWKVR